MEPERTERQPLAKNGEAVPPDQKPAIGRGPDFASPSTTRGPFTLNFGSTAMCSDALRNAGLRSSGGLRANFHGDNTGSNPVGDDK